MECGGDDMPEGTNVESLARKAVSLAQSYIVMRLRFMDMAVFRLAPSPADITLATEGAHLYYGEKHVLRRYMRADQAGLARDYLHVLMHCVFRHPFIDSLVDEPRWNLACDIAVEDVILSLEDAGFDQPDDAEKRVVIRQLAKHVRPLTAEKLYRYFADHPPMQEWHAMFMTDDHVLWHKPKQARQMAQPGDGDEGDASEGGGKPRNDGGDRQPPEGEEAQPMPPGDGDGSQEGSRASASDADDDDPGEQNQRAAMCMPGDDESAEREERRTMEAQASEGETGKSMGEYRESHNSENRSVGRGMDTEGRDGMSAGSQSRNDRTEGGLDAPHSLGSGGDSGDARSQSSASETGGSGSGQNDALMAPEAGENAPEASMDEDESDDDRDATAREWKEVAERIQTDLDTFSRRRGQSAGALMTHLGEINREKIDYAAFLRRFTVLGEAAEINDEEFEHIFYTYGLRLYGNLPLIEPLETREVKRVRDFVIAIDTSASTSGDLVKKFLEKTRAILKGEENFFRKINLYIVQCDARVQEAVQITSQEAFDEYMADLEIKGLGGTDFRPVFRYVDELAARGAFTHLKGLIYFTDGFGTYPARKPDYDAAFVFLRDAHELPEVPPWAIRVVLEPEDI